MKLTHASRRHRGAITSLPPTAALRAFECAGTRLSFQDAAKALSISPSAVSHQIRALEERYGVALFERSRRSVQLTANGKRYLQSVSAALRMLDAAGRDLAEDRGAQVTTLRISSLPFFTSAVLIPSLADFEQRHPGLTLHIDTTHRYADFDASDVDIAIRYGRQRSAGLSCEPLVEAYGVPVCAPALALRRLEAPADLSRQVLIHVAAQPRAWSSWLDAAGLSGLKPKAELWVGSVPAALEAAEHGLGVALAIHPLINSRKGFGDTLVAPLEVPMIRMETVYLVTRPRHKHLKHITAFRRWIAGAVARASSAKALRPA